MQYPAFKCDECGRQKQDANHWWWMTRAPGPRIVVAPFECPVRDENAPLKHLCGEECVLKAVSKEMKAG